MKTFWIADLQASGELREKQVYDYARLEQIPGCVQLIGTLSSELYRHPEEFEVQLGFSVTFRWRATADTAGIATTRCGSELASLSLVLSGLKPDADLLTLAAFQQHMLRKLHDTGYEPAFSLLELNERPLAAIIDFHSPPDENERWLVALADRCFAAAYFRYLQLA